MWKEGSIQVCGEIFHYWIKRYDEPFQYGIDGGRISKLTIKRDGIKVYNYDRYVDVAPADEATEAVLAILLHSEN